ncbi:MAG: sulfur carrier protein ThiS [Balneolaceae bacterium]|nr:sulfur carrier protein ThiS [Balneolaceae bacterium]
MNLTVNGDTVETEAATVKELVQEYDVELNGKGTAVAVNDAVVPRDKWGQHALQENDRVEIIRATQGG